jgi:hypothetical protein
MNWVCSRRLHHRHSQIAKTAPQEPISCVDCQRNQRSIITDRTKYNNKPDIVLLDETIKEEYLIEVVIPDSHNLYSTITERLQKYT